MRLMQLIIALHLLACQKPVSVTGAAAKDACSILPVQQWSPDGLRPTNVYCETNPYSSIEDKRVVLYFENAPSNWTLSGDLIAPKSIESGENYLPGTCKLLLGDSEAQAYLKGTLQHNGIPLPPSTAQYSLINTSSDILETLSFAHNYVEVLRSGKQVWLSTSTCGLS